MAIDYKAIAEKHRRLYGEANHHLRLLYKDKYSDKAHFISELIQNADDAKSKNLTLILRDRDLLVVNDGEPFDEQDVRNICSIGRSDKDLTKIGRFGIGFKSVYAYTDCPEIYSNKRRFRIKRLIEPERIGEVPDYIKDFVDNTNTVFRLSFKENIKDKDIDNIRKRMHKLENCTFLFLRHLETVKWKDEEKKEYGIYLRSRQSHKAMPNAEKIELITQVNEEEKSLEEWLVFSQKSKPDLQLIEELLSRAEDDKEREQIKKSANKEQRFEVAFRLKNGQIVPIKDGVLFACLPTQKETHLKFLLQARYQTTAARDNIPKSSQWNRWLIEMTAKFLPEALQQLKDAKLLIPKFFDVISLPEDNVHEIFQPIVDKLRFNLKEGEFIPTDKGDFSCSKQVFYPHSEDLRKLLTAQDLAELTEVKGATWLHQDIRNTESSRRRFRVMREAGVVELTAGRLVSWLIQKDKDWLADKSDEWLLNLYKYLSNQKAEIERLKKIPLIRLENGEHVSAIEQPVFFPPDSEKEHKKLAPFLNELSVVRTKLIQREENNDIKQFLRNIGVQRIEPAIVISDLLLPKYRQSLLPSVKENQIHIRYLKSALERVSLIEKNKLVKEIRQTQLLWAYQTVEKKGYKFVKPDKAYLSEAYTEEKELETYFTLYNDVWFVDEGYLEQEDEKDEWCKFLKELGVEDSPRRIANPEEPLSWEEKRKLRGESYTRDEPTEDWLLEGLDLAFDYILQGKDYNNRVALALWDLLINKIKSEKDYQRNQIFQGTYKYFYYKNKSRKFDATFFRQLKETAWLPDEQGNYHKPDELFAPTSENRKVLGDSVAYLHPDFDVKDKPKNEPARWLADKLSIHLNADTESVMDYLRSLSKSTAEVDVETLESIYRFLDERSASRQEEFENKPLLFTPKPEPHWWKSGEVFWEDESPVFGDLRGYLKEHYSEKLETFFISVGVNQSASFRDYVQAIREIATKEKVTDEIRERILLLYRRIENELQERSDLPESELWQQVFDGKCWLGCKGNELNFCHRKELVYDDHGYLAQLFEGKMPFWTFRDELKDLKNYLEIEPCSQAQKDFSLNGERERLPDWSKKLYDCSNYILRFLCSPQWYNQYQTLNDQLISELNVYLVEGIRVNYTLKGTTVIEKDPRPSHLDDYNLNLYLALDAEKEDFPELIGGALQEYFDVKELREFVKDLLKDGHRKVLRRWRHRGLKLDLPPDNGEKESEGNGNDGNSQGNESKNGKKEKARLIVRSKPEGAEIFIDSQFYDRTPCEINLESGNYEVVARLNEQKKVRSVFLGPGEEKSPITFTFQNSKTPRSSPNRGPHDRFRDYLANNPELLESELHSSETEHSFPTGSDRADLIFKTANGIPVAVEVEVEVTSGQLDCLWQAIKYKHLLAVEKDYPCKEVQAFLVAHKIADDIKQRGSKYGVECKEISENRTLYRH